MTVAVVVCFAGGQFPMASHRPVAAGSLLAGTWTADQWPGRAGTSSKTLPWRNPSPGAAP